MKVRESCLTWIGLNVITIAVAHAEVVFQSNFDDGLPPEMSGVTTLVPVQGLDGIGELGREFGGQMLVNRSTSMGSESARFTKITLVDLPPHDSISLSFLFAVIDTWDGSANARALSASP